MKYIIPIDVQVDLGEGIFFDEARTSELIQQLGDDIVAVLCCRNEVEVDLANQDNNASRAWNVNLDWNSRGGFDPKPQT